MGKTKIILKHFIAFLRKNNIETIFIDNLKNDKIGKMFRFHWGYPSTSHKFILQAINTTPFNLINFAFDWALTPQGAIFWSEINDEWIEYYLVNIKKK